MQNDHSRRCATIAVLALLTLASCGESGSEPVQEPPRAAAIAISPQSATFSSLAETASFTATVTDQYGDPFTAPITWSTSDAEVFTVSFVGEVTAVANGSGTLTAAVEALSATAEVTVAQQPAALAVTSGGAQEGLAGRALPEPVVVRVDDAGGSPVADVAVSFTAAERHGVADPASVVTDPAGMASTNWTLGEVSGIQSLIASAADGVSTEIRAVAGEVPLPSDTAVYSITFNATWSATTHPTNFPPGPHFSPLIGAVHNDSVSFWASGEIASPGIEQMAETGGTSNLTREIRAHIPGNALSVINGRGIGSPASTTIEGVHLSLDYPIITLVTMIAPSPDWFVGVAGQSLQDEFGQWVDELQVVLYPYDSGTDDGVSYRSANADSSPKQPIKGLKGISPFSDEPIGTYTFTRTDTGGSG